MRYTNKDIQDTIREFVNETKQDRLFDVIPFCIGYYGYISKQIWNEIYSLIVEGIIQR
ncbi:MAG: hypothetical protein J6Q89_05905 [Clostridia bacterium]|nr:hypothetical protein [Clostridia bacterium]